MDRDVVNRRFAAGEHWSGVAKRWRLTAAAGVAGSLLGLGSSYLVTPSYQATATVQVGYLAQPQQVAESMEIARAVLTGTVVTAKAVEALGLNRQPLSIGSEAFRERVSIEEPSPGSLLLVRVRLPAPDLAAKAANAVVAEGALEFERYWAARRASVFRDLEEREDAAKRALDGARETVKALREANRLPTPKTEIEWFASRELLREQPFLDLDIAARAYSEAADRTWRARLESAAAWRHLRPISAAVASSRPVYPKRWLSTLLGLVLGLLVAGAAVSWLEWTYGRDEGRP